MNYSKKEENFNLKRKLKQEEIQNVKNRKYMSKILSMLIEKVLGLKH